jgi:hypothetical protein
MELLLLCSSKEDTSTFCQGIVQFVRFAPGEALLPMRLFQPKMTLIPEKAGYDFFPLHNCSICSLLMRHSKLVATYGY